MTIREQEDLAPEEPDGVLCRCGHLLTDSDLHFCGYCGSVIQVTSGRRTAPAAVVSGRRAALAALASERNAAPAEPATDRFVAPARPAPVVLPADVMPMRPVAGPSCTTSAEPQAVDPPAVDPPAVDPPAVDPPAMSLAAEPVPATTTTDAAAAAAATASATRAARAARAARTTRPGRPARVARGARVATAAAAGPSPAPVTPAPVTPAPVTPAPATPAPVTPAPATPAPVMPAPVTPNPATRTVSPVLERSTPSAAGETPDPPEDRPTDAPGPGDGLVPIAPGARPADGEGAEPDRVSEPEAEPDLEDAPRTTVFGRRTWPAWLCLTAIVIACATRTALGLAFTYPGYLSWLPIVLVGVLALAKAARFSVGLVATATSAVTAWWVVDHVVSTARLQALGYDVSQPAIPVPLLVAAVGSIPLAVVLCGLVDGHVRSTVREWVVPRGSGLHVVRAAVVVLAVLAALFPVVRSATAEPGFAALTAARDQVRYPGYPTPGQIADRMRATSVAKGRPVSVTCTYAPPDGEPRPSYECVAVSAVGGEAAQVHDGIRSTALPDGSYSCVDFTRGVDRRLC